MSELYDFYQKVKAFAVRHKTPCNECPYRRTAPAGWLGPDPLDWYTQAVEFDAPISCHKTRDKKKEPAACAGSLIHIKNQCKSPRPPALAAAVDKVEEDTKTVFQWPREFKEHHEQGLLAQKAKRRISK